ncbi:MAG: hypothetical protein IJC18_04435, partial [Clostridia bacterium]|nr:hypothetical protein [Clostridia bacterium]
DAGVADAAAANAAPMNTSAAAGVRASLPASYGEGGELHSLAEKIDALLDYLAGGEQVMQIDGRTFGRIVREYV